jgi:hypothetical protein
MITNAMLCADIASEIPYVVVQLSMSRNLVGSLLKDFLPVLLCLVIGHSTNYFNSFEVSAGTNLTLLLVLITL